jgi:hypothetical protein
VGQSFRSPLRLHPGAIPHAGLVLGTDGNSTGHLRRRDQWLWLTGPGQAMQPHNFVEVDSTTDGTHFDAHTFQWMKEGIPAGSAQTVNIFFATDFPGGSAGTGFRTATIQLYLN